MPRITKIEATRTAHRKKLRVAAYARVSTNREHQLASLETQKKHYEKYRRKEHAPDQKRPGKG